MVHNFRKYGFFVVFLLIILILYYFLLLPKIEVNQERLRSKQIIPWSIKVTNVNSYWNAGIYGQGIKVAVLDTGIDYNHPDFGTNIHNGYNAITLDQLPIDDNGHGTLMSGVIAAQNNDVGIVGVSPQVELYPVKVLDQFGEGELSNVASGIEWCIQNKIQIINMSFAIHKDNPVLKNSIQKAIDAGIIVVASGSNSSGGDVGFPASYEHVLSITTIDQDFKAGKTSPKGKIDFSAPGVDIISTDLNNSYTNSSGTSIAAPFITGIIALLLESNPGYLADHDSLYKKMCLLSKDLGLKGKDSVYGNGLIKLTEPEVVK